MIDILRSNDLEDFSIYEDSGEVHSLITGDYDLPDDGFEPLLLFNFYKVENKNNKSIYLLELKDNCEIEEFSSKCFLSVSVTTSLSSQSQFSVFLLLLL